MDEQAIGVGIMGLAYAGVELIMEIRDGNNSPEWARGRIADAVAQAKHHFPQFSQGIDLGAAHLEGAVQKGLEFKAAREAKR